MWVEHAAPHPSSATADGGDDTKPVEASTAAAVGQHEEQLRVLAFARSHRARTSRAHFARGAYKSGAFREKTPDGECRLRLYRYQRTSLFT